MPTEEMQIEHAHTEKKRYRDVQNGAEDFRVKEKLLY